MRPDAIIRQGGSDVRAVREEDVRAIADRITPPPTILSIDARHLDGVFANISLVAAAKGAPDEGVELLAGLRYRLRRMHETLKAARAPRLRGADCSNARTGSGRAPSRSGQWTAKR